MRLLILICLLIATSGSPRANAEDGNTIGAMADSCQRADGDFFKTYCFTYISAVLDVEVMYGLQSNKLGKACIPDSVLARQAAAVFVKWAANNPEKHHQPAITGIVDSLITAFPCRAY